MAMESFAAVITAMGPQNGLPWAPLGTLSLAML